MSISLSNALIGDELITPPDKFSKLCSGQLVKSCGITQTIPSTINKATILLSFHILVMEDLDFFIGHTLMKVLHLHHERSLDINLKKNFNLSILTNSTHSNTKSNLEPYPMGKVITTSLESYKPS
jgi:hypothetical protein